MAIEILNPNLWIHVYNRLATIPDLRFKKTYKKTKKLKMSLIFDKNKFNSL